MIWWWLWWWWCWRCWPQWPPWEESQGAEQASEAFSPPEDLPRIPSRPGWAQHHRLQLINTAEKKEDDDDLDDNARLHFLELAFLHCDHNYDDDESNDDKVFTCTAHRSAVWQRQEGLYRASKPGLHWRWQFYEIGFLTITQYNRRREYLPEAFYPFVHLDSHLPGNNAVSGGDDVTVLICKMTMTMTMTMTRINTWKLPWRGQSCRHNWSKSP